MTQVITYSRMEASTYDLAADYKARRIERQSSYSQFVKDRGLRPEIDAKEFFAIYDYVSPRLFQNQEITGEVHFTHRLTTKYNSFPIQIVEETDDYVKWIGEGGHAGTDPKMYIVSLEPL